MKKITHWKDTVIKDIKWKQPKLTTTEDGKLDFNIHIPLTDLFETQAKYSFMAGVVIALNFYGDAQTINKVITQAELHEWMNKIGMGDIVNKLKENK